MKKKLIAIIMALALVLTLTPMAYADSPPGGTQQLIQINGKTASATMSATGTVNLKIVMPENDALNGVGSFTVNLTFDKSKLELTGLEAPDVEYKTSGDILIANLEGSIGSTDDGGNFTLTTDYTAMNSSGELTFNAPSKDTSAENSNLLNLSGKTLINATFTVKENALNVGDKPGDETVDAAKKIASLFTLTKCEVTKHVAGDKSAGTSKGGATEYIVELAGGANTPTYCYAAATNSVEVVAGFEVSGTVTSWNNKDDVVLRLYSSATSDADIQADMKLNSPEKALSYGVTKGGSITQNSANAKQYDQTYSFTEILDGTYKLAVYKPDGYVTYIESITVNGASIEKDIQLGLLGDVNGDGSVTAADLTSLARHVAKIEVITEKENLLRADVTGEGDVSANDLTKLARYIAKIISTLE